MDAKYHDHLSQESNRETDKADGFADDNSSATLANLESLSALKESCSEFSLISGLQSNAEKTTLLQIGNVNNLSDEILQLGFTVSNEVTLLGMLVNRDLSSLADYFDSVQIKLARIVEYWERFKLTLPGRITVCKTFMISQIGYLGSVITPTEAQTRNMQAILDNFCLGSMNTARKKRYIPATEGGLGLINGVV